MGFVPQITCRHCGNKFTGLLHRCPKCGTPRVKPGATPTPKAAAEDAKSAAAYRSDTKWQLIFGCVLIALVIVAVIVLISTSLGPAGKPIETPNIAPVEVTTPPPATPVPTPVATPTPTVPVTSVAITFLGSPTEEFALRLSDPPLQLSADVYPVEAVTDAKLVWSSSDEGILTVDQTGKVTAVGAGWAEVIAECGGITCKCNVWVH